MINLKTYEEITGPELKYWRVNCFSLHYIEVSLKKIGINKNDKIYQELQELISRPFDSKFFIDYFYIGQFYDWWAGEVQWTYSTDIKFFRKKAKYQGQVKVEKWELEADKYNL